MRSTGTERKIYFMLCTSLWTSKSRKQKSKHHTDRFVFSSIIFLFFFGLYLYIRINTLDQYFQFQFLCLSIMLCVLWIFLDYASCKNTRDLFTAYIRILYTKQNKTPANTKKKIEWRVASFEHLVWIESEMCSVGHKWIHTIVSVLLLCRLPDKWVSRCCGHSVL